jgi:hypothetical protein
MVRNITSKSICFTPSFHNLRRRARGRILIYVDHRDLSAFFGKPLACCRSDSSTAARYDHDFA